MRRPSIYALFASLTLSGHVFARPASSDIQPLKIAIEKIFAGPGVWNGFDPRAVRLAIGTPGQTEALLFQFSDAQRSGVNRWSHVSLQKIPQPANGVYEPITPKANGSELEVLASRMDTPALFILSSPKIGETPFTPEETARIAIHESFHFAYQFAGRFRMDRGFDRDFLDGCVKNPAWLSQVKEEFVQWQSLLQDWDSLTSQEFSARVASAVDGRASSPDSEVARCWDATAFWERIEGTAFFIESESAKRAGFVTDAQVRAETLKYLNLTSHSVCTGCPDSENGKLNPTFFYGTGALISSILNRLTGRLDYQEEIEQGRTPIDVLFQELPKRRP